MNLDSNDMRFPITATRTVACLQSAPCHERLEPKQRPRTINYTGNDGGRFGSTACLVCSKGVQTDKDETTEIQTFSRPLSLLENELGIQILRSANEM